MLGDHLTARPIGSSTRMVARQPRNSYKEKQMFQGGKKPLEVLELRWRLRRRRYTLSNPKPQDFSLIRFQDLEPVTFQLHFIAGRRHFP